MFCKFVLYLSFVFSTVFLYVFFNRLKIQNHGIRCLNMCCFYANKRITWTAFNSRSFALKLSILFLYDQLGTGAFHYRLLILFVEQKWRICRIESKDETTLNRELSWSAWVKIYILLNNLWKLIYEHEQFEPTIEYKLYLLRHMLKPNATNHYF